MSIEKLSKDIGNHTYTVAQLDGVKGAKVLVRLGNALGPALADPKNMLDAASKLLLSLKESDMDYLCEVFGPLTEVSGGSYEKPKTLTKIAMMQHFAGNYMELVDWLTFCCVEVNFASFFDGISARIKELIEKVIEQMEEGNGASVIAVVKSSTSPTAPTGSSGD